MTFIYTRQFTRATHCSVSRTKIIGLYDFSIGKALKTILHCWLLQTHYKLIGYVLIPKPHFSSREGINSRCRRFVRSCRRSCCRRSDGPLAFNRDPSRPCVVAAQFIAAPAGRWRWTMTAVSSVAGSIQLTIRVGDEVFAVVFKVFRV